MTSRTRRRAMLFVGAPLAIVLVVAFFLYWRTGAPADLPNLRDHYVALIDRYLVDSEGKRLAGENRWDVIEQIVALHDDVKTREMRLPRDSPRVDFDIIGWGVEGTEEARARTLATIAEYKRLGLPELLDQMAAAERFVRPPQDDYAINWLLPELSVFREMTRLSAARMQLALQAGDTAEAARAFEHMMALARASTQDPIVISHYVSYALTYRALDPLRAFLMEEPRSAVDIRRFQVALERQRLQVPLALAIEGHQLLDFDTLRMVYDHPESSPSQVVLALQGGSNTPSRGRALLEVHRRWGGIPRRSKAIETSRHLGDMLLAAARGPTEELAAAMKAAEAHAHTLTMRDTLASLMMPNTTGLARSYLVTLANLRGMQLMLAIELHRSETGRYPDSLEALVPKYIASLPSDPFTGDAFIYRLIAPGADEHGRGYILYSTGPDQIDNGGVVALDLKRAIASPYLSDAVVLDDVDLVINWVPEQD